MLGTPQLVSTITSLKQYTLIPVVFSGLFVVRGNKRLKYVFYVCNSLFIALGLGRMANKEYRQFLTCLINAQQTKGSFKRLNVCTIYSINISLITLCRLNNQALINTILR